MIQKPLAPAALETATMSIRVERAEFDPVQGYLYYVIFKPQLEIGVEDVQMVAEVDATVSLTENGELADVTFVLPKRLRNPQAVAFICGEGQGTYVEPRVHAAVEGVRGDTVVSVPGRLDVDMAGRIVGMVLHWEPTVTAGE
jgi:hypothetical protein